MLRNIAVVKVTWVNEYFSNEDIWISYPTNFVEGLPWKEVDEEEFEEIKKFIDSQGSYGKSKYVLFEKDENTFQKDFDVWKDKVNKEKQMLRRKEESIKKREETRKKNFEAKKIEKAKEILEKSGCYECNYVQRDKSK